METETPPTSYDTIRYPGMPYADTHPDHLAAVATYFGLRPAAPQRCRVLELGCGDGGNLVPMAHAFPASHFVGIDLAGEAIREAREFARRSEVGNVVFEQRDLARVPEDAGTFDYIIAHGVYSWVPMQVRDALMKVIDRHLAPDGVAFVSYNTYPGCHVRRMVWDMLKFHTGELADPQSQLAEARALIRLVGHGNLDPGEYAEPLVAEVRRMEQRPPALLFHDDLSATNDPVYFHEFVDHAARHGLQYLAEAAFVTASHADITAEARGILATLDPITRQQYLDFIKCRRFRETLLCRSAVAVDRSESPERLRAFTFTAARRVRTTRRNGGMPARASGAPGALPGDDADAVLMRAVLDVLRAATPHPLGFDDIVARIRAHPALASVSARESIRLGGVLLAGVQVGIVDLHVAPPRVASPPGEWPAASRVVRAQVADGHIVTSLLHHPVQIDDEIAEHLLPLLDGSRNRRVLRVAMAGLLSASDPGALDEHLDRLGRLALLVA